MTPTTVEILDVLDREAADTRSVTLARELDALSHRYAASERRAAAELIREMVPEAATVTFGIDDGDDGEFATLLQIWAPGIYGRMLLWFHPEYADNDPASLRMLRVNGGRCQPYDLQPASRALVERRLINAFVADSAGFEPSAAGREESLDSAYVLHMDLTAVIRADEAHAIEDRIQVDTQQAILAGAGEAGTQLIAVTARCVALGKQLSNAVDLDELHRILNLAFGYISDENVDPLMEEIRLAVVHDDVPAGGLAERLTPAEIECALLALAALHNDPRIALSGDQEDIADKILHLAQNICELCNDEPITDPDSRIGNNCLTAKTGQSG